MNIILVTSPSKGKARSFRLNVSHWHVLAVAVVTIFAAASLTGLAGYEIGLRDGHGPIIAKWQKKLTKQRRLLTATREQSDAHITALTQRLGYLQAHINRLDALGSKLVEMAGLETEEFDFSATPALGGPAPLLNLDAKSRGLLPDISIALEDLAVQLEDREQQLRVLEHLIQSRNLVREIHPEGRPILEGWISSSYGMRTDPFTGQPELHRGVDFAGRPGSNIIAVATGVVAVARSRGAWGKLIVIDHGKGYVTRYGHNEELLVKEGDTVKKGQVIAKMGSTGRSTGVHVHFEVLQDGKHVDPMKYVRGSG
ncbi:MAG: M23 family metallopeptidase [Gammaproteobacteria bacterium]